MALIHRLIAAILVIVLCVARGCVLPETMPAAMVEAGFSRRFWDELRKRQQVQIDQGRACTSRGKACNFTVPKWITLAGRCETKGMPVCNHISSDGRTIAVPFHPACSAIASRAFIQQIVEFSSPKANELLRDLGYEGHLNVATGVVPCNISKKVEDAQTGHCFQHISGHGCRNSKNSVFYHTACEPGQ